MSTAKGPSGDHPAQPVDAGRRSLLKHVGLAAAICPFFGTTVDRAAAEIPQRHQVTEAPIANAASVEDKVPFLGRQQAGITSARPANGMIASFIVVADTPDELEKLFRRLHDRIAFLTQGGAPPDLDPRFPPADSGIVGPVIKPDALSITIALGASLFDERPWLKPHRPAHLIRMERFANDALAADLCHGDLTLQICANTQDTTIHALRDILKNIPDQLVLKWKQEGNVPVITPGPDGTVESARNFLGFRDGSANPDSTDSASMMRIVWVGSERGEPSWAIGGSYQVVRLIRNFVERWDRTPLREQERIIGRRKMSGAPLSKPDATEFVLPDFAEDDAGAMTPLDAHIRLANPRNAAAGIHQILRRPFNYSNGVTKSGQLDQGLLFICYQSDLQQGFVAMQKRLDGEPLEEYIKPIGGGYFYVLPGVERASDYLGSTLIAAVRNADSSTRSGKAG